MIVLDDGDIRFKSADEALKQAFNASSQAYDRPTMNRMAAPSLGRGGLVGLESPGQAGMVRAEVQALGKLAEAILVAKYAPMTAPCSCGSPCCSGHAPNREWRDAKAFLADYIRTTVLAGCISNGAMRGEYLVRYFSPKDCRISIEDLAERHDTNRNTVSAHYAKVAAWLSGVPMRKGKPGTPGMLELAYSAIDERLRASGNLIE